MSGADERDPADRDANFRYAPDPANPGWMIWALRSPTRFNAVLEPIIVRQEAPQVARVRMQPTHAHSNLMDAVHGAAIMAFIDVALFAGARTCGIAQAADAVTLDCQTQFLSRGEIDAPLDAVVEILRETGRLIFVRGLIEQGEARIAAFSATLRKATIRP